MLRRIERDLDLEDARLEIPLGSVIPRGRSRPRADAPLGDEQAAGDERGAADGRQRDRLAVERRAERQRAERQHQRDVGHRHRRQLAQQDVSITNGTAEPKRRGRRSSRPPRRPRAPSQSSPSAETASSSTPPASIAQPLSATASSPPPRRFSRRCRSRSPAARPRRRRGGQRAAASPSSSALAEGERQPAERDRDAAESRGCSGSPAQQQRREHARVERQHAEQHGGQARRDVLLAPVDQPVGGGERQQRRARRPAARRCAAAGPAPRGASEQPEPGEREPQPGAEQRRHVLEADLDRHPGARPDHDEAGVEGPDERAGHGRAR